MSNTSNTIKFLRNLITYNGPKDVEGFELLETEYEGTERDGYDEKINDQKRKTAEQESKNSENEDKKKNIRQGTQKNQQENVQQSNQESKNSEKTQDKRETDDVKKSKKPLNVDEWNQAKNKEDKVGEKEPTFEESGSSGKDEGKGEGRGEEDSQSTANIKKVSPKLYTNLKKIQDEFISNKNSDIIIRQFKIGKQINAFITFIDGMADRETINNFILRQLMLPELFQGLSNEECSIEYIEDNVLAVHDTKREKNYEMIIRQILNGLTALFVDGCNECILFETRGYEKRGVERPSTENVIRGSQEGFNENLRTNITLIRRIIKNSHLVTEVLPVGRENNSHCGILYIDGITNPRIVNEVKRRIKSLDIDYVHGDGMIEQLIEDDSSSIFPQALSTERPDRAASFLIDGKVVIIVDGTPFALAVPINFYNMLRTSEESNMKWQYGTVIRIIRVFGLLVSVLLPGAYIALVLYHQEMIPTDLLTAIAKSRENVPFPVVVETILMELSFELIREAGLRVPGIIGTTLGIIGALILGQAAVAANIVSPILIIVVAVTGLGSFALPNFSLGISTRILRFFLIFFGAIAGFYGISVGIVIIGGFLCSIKSFGVPFVSPVAPKTMSDAELILKKPMYEPAERPDALNTLKRRKASANPRKWGDNKNK
ncbi:MAG TPA: spore germination protein [Clostridiales bacterium]|nr:spore germination protein [Clostridiales bacterium]